ncbi:MAG: helix-turn-helix domain-containing protein [Pseudomonadota bacterium]
MTGFDQFETGLASMAAFALVWRCIGYPEQRPILWPLAAFQLGLACFGLLASASPGVELTVLLALIAVLPIFLQLHMSALAHGKVSRRMWLLACLTPLLVPFLLGPRDAQDMILQGVWPETTGSAIMVLSIGAFALAALVSSTILTLSVIRAWVRHQRLLREIYAQPVRGAATFRVLVISAPIGVLIAYLVLLTASLGGADIDVWGLERSMIVLASFGFAAHGMTIEKLPDWAMDLVPDTPDLPQTPMYARSGLGEADLDAILERLDSAMTQHQLWLNPKLSLKGLSETIGVRPGYLSQALNQRREVSFFDYVNAHRIDDASERLIASDETILDICFTVGFNAKSTFNAAFRKQKGETPSAWRKRHQAIEPAT